MRLLDGPLYLVMLVLNLQLPNPIVVHDLELNLLLLLDQLLLVETIAGHVIGVLVPPRARIFAVDTGLEETRSHV